MSNYQRARRYVKFIMTFTAGLLVALSAFAQTSTGNIYGTVVDENGGALPGVTVTINSGGMQQTFVTETDGAFRFLRLAPGNYRVSGELAGFGTGAQNVQVNIGANTDVSLLLAPQLSEILTVIAATPLLDARDTGTGDTITQTEIEQLPTARDPWVMLQQIPGVLVDRVNVGGNKSGQQSYFVSKGAERNQTSWNIDGVNVTEMDETGTSTFYFDFGSFAEFQVVTSSADPSIRTPGATVNMVTKHGTNDLQGNARGFWSDEALQATASGPATLREGNRVDNVTELGADLSGPIVRDKAWFFGSYSQNAIGNITSSWLFPQETELTNWTGKLNAQPASNNNGSVYYMFSDKTVNARGLAATRPPETARVQTGPSWVAKLEDTQMFGSNFVVTGLVTRVDGGYKQVPRGGMDTATYWVNTQGLNGEDRGWHRSYSMAEQAIQQNNYRGDASTFFRTGTISHELKFGAGYRDQATEWWVLYPGNQTWGEFYTDPADNLAAFTRAAHPLYVGEYLDAYIGDTVSFGDLTLQGGFRYDLQRAYNKASDVPENPVIPDILIATRYEGDDRKLEWKTLVPKLGATYALGAEKRTLVRASYSRYADQLGASDAGANNPFYDHQILYYPWADANGDKIVQRNEVDLTDLVDAVRVNPANLGGGADSVGRVDYDNSDPTTTDEFILGVEHELVPGWAVGINYTHRIRENFIWTQFEKTQGGGDFYTPDDYVLGAPITGTMPDGSSYSIPVYVLKAGVPRPTYYASRNRPDYEQTYDGVEMMATRRMNNRWSMRGQLTLSDWKQHVGRGGIQNPSPLLEGDGCYTCDGSAVASNGGSDGYINSRWAYSLTGLYQAPWQINLGAVVTGREGYINGFHRRVRFDGVFRRYVIDDFEDHRFPNLFQLDLRAGKEFQMPGGFGVELSVDAFNVTNERTVLWRDYEVVAPAGGGASDETAIQEMQSPRIFRLGARVRF
ncbi:MAG TPA: TonB-dependent receptor [Thermoanaerobaculia bacterium]|nr:TonB-dependent receptor [Thermoanaerobaculia bacterium]